MSTGIEAWKNLSEIGPLYPFVGTEGVIFIIALVLWIGWHVLQIGNENRHHEDTVKLFKKKKKQG